MDPLSISCSVVAFLTLSSKFVEYVKEAAGATESWKLLSCRIEECQSIVERIKVHADNDADDGVGKWSETLRTLESPGGPLWRLSMALDFVKDKIEPKPGLRRALSVIKWPSGSSEVQRLISNVEAEKTLLSLALTSDCQ